MSFKHANCGSNKETKRLIRRRSKSFGINYGYILAAMSVGSVIGPQLAVRLSTLLFFGVGIAFLLFTALALYTSRVAVNKEIGQKIF